MTNMDKKMIKWIIPLLLIGGFISCTNGGKEEKETCSVKMARSEIQRFPEPWMIEKAKKQFEAEGHRASSIKSIQVYLKPEEYAAYYVINQKHAGRVDLF